ncbi:MAG: AAA family ATPase [Candidatus Aenigmatarchaeota archaeon]
MNTLLTDYETEVNDWFKHADLDENPFTLRIIPEVFVGYNKELRRISYHIEENRKFALIAGATGSGKTTLLRLIEDSFNNEFKIVYFSKPPEMNELTDIFLEKIPPSFFQRLFGFDVSVHDLSDYLNKQLDERLLLLLDEAHESDVKVLQWLRTITDQVNEIQLIMAGLPSIDSKLDKEIETLKSRVTTRIDLSTLSKEETEDLIKNRIEKAGGEDFGPFTRECVDEIYEKTGGFPREVLKLCNKLINRAMEEDETEIDCVGDMAEEDEDEEEKSNSRDLLQDLPYKQREIVKVLAEEDDLYPSEIAEELGTESYKTKQHAVRSINNILRRMLKEDLIERKRKGKGYIYSLNIKTKNLLVET